MSKNRLGLSAKKADRLFMGIQLDAQFDALNTPLRTRKGALRITYVDHHPRLWVKTINSDPECVAIMDTRTKQMRSIMPKIENNKLLCDHIFANMGDLDCIIALSYDIEPKTQRKRVRLQLRSNESRIISHTLHWLWKGEQSPWLNEFIIAQHPLAPGPKQVSQAAVA